MKYFVGMLAIVAVVAGVTVGGYRAWDKATHTRDDNGGVLTAGPSTTKPAPLPSDQLVVTGTVTAVHLEGAALAKLAMPITVETADRGTGGATITPVVVNG
ncbi:MAG TPA: hypothetical protein VGZ52_05295, partial [Acidimicrobiales bacterium]|nr:hypothetical protein [Acidimicrobiales bacterium]